MLDSINFLFSFCETSSKVQVHPNIHRVEKFTLTSSSAAQATLTEKRIGPTTNVYSPQSLPVDLPPEPTSPEQLYNLFRIESVSSELPVKRTE